MALSLALGAPGCDSDDPSPDASPDSFIWGDELGGPPATSSLPRAEDVLPKGEVSAGSVVVKGEGFRFQVMPTFKRIAHPKSKVAFRATIKGIIKPAEVTLYVTREPFTGDLAARETKSVTDKGGKLWINRPIKAYVAGKFGPAHRFKGKVGGKVELRVMVAHGGHAYILHCETPDVPAAWPNVGSDCMIRGATFHIAPPK